MRDFSEQYRGVKHFGLWAEEGADSLGIRDAWIILAAAVRMTVNEDVRSKDLEDALTFLENFSSRDRPYKDFRKALSIVNPSERFRALKDASDRIWKSLT